ncbi:MAG: ATP-binding protein, partial [Gemmatimonadales bacterium]
QEALEAARVSEHRFQLALEGSSIVAWACDADRRYTWVHNQPAILRTHEIIGRRAGSLLPQDKYPEYAEALERVWRTGIGERLSMSWTHEGVTRHYLSSIEPVKGVGGVITGLVGASVDVTEQRRMDAALRESEERLRLALEGAQVGMWVTDSATGLTECTPFNYELYGFDPHSPPLPVDTWFQAIHPEDRPQVQAAWTSTLEQGAPFALEFRIVRPDGVVRWLDVRAQRHRDGEQAPARVVGISMDVTGRKDAEVALREAGRSKDEFLATLAHELRNPLAPLRTAAYLLNTPGLDDGARRDAQQMIERQVGHLSRLVDDLLEVSRVTLGRIELLRERVSVALVVEHAVEAARSAIEEGGHRLQLDLPATPLWVDADLVRLSQVYTNLLTNAARYTPAGGQITMRVYARGGDAVVSVEDTGIGIAPEMLGHVFEMFVQVPHGDRARHGGLGIGLALSKRLVELHGGTIEAWSQGEGCGSEFRVLMPREERPRVEAKPVARSPVVAEGRRILVVDDNVDAALSLAILLELLGHEVETAHDGHDALKRITTEPFHVVLLDIGMPTLNGYDVARLVRERMGARAPKLVALTGWGQSADRARSAEAGFDHHLLKPADPGVIAQVIEALAGANAH